MSGIFIWTTIVLLSLIVVSHTQSLDKSDLVHATPSCMPCRCVNNADGQLKVDCSRRNLKYIPLTLPTTVADIDFEGNDGLGVHNESSICDIYKELKKISLSNNNLKEAHEVLRGCNTLEELDLTGNTLTAESLEQTFLNLKGLLSLKGLITSGNLDQKIFSPLRKLERLELSYNEPSFPTEIFSDLVNLHDLHLNLLTASKFDNAPLKAENLERLYLKGPKIRDIPASFFSDLEDLTLLDLDLPHLNSLKYLPSALKHLSIKNVWQVNASTFSGLLLLQTLQLNDIDTLAKDPGMFAQQKMLEVLEITGCDLKSLPASWLNKLESLHDLNLSDNKISKLSSKALYGLSNLTTIDLSYNRITAIPQGFLEPVADKLESLILNTNMMGTVQGETFPTMKNLLDLDVSKNSLVEFDLNISQQMPTLIILQLQQNSITNLTGSLSSNVQKVNLSYNYFGNLPDGLFVESLIDLDVSGNSVTLPVNKIMDHENLKELTIKDITVKCDCPMQQLIKSKVVHGGKCESDEGDMNREVGDILNELLCEEDIITTPDLPNQVEAPHQNLSGSKNNQSQAYYIEGIDQFNSTSSVTVLNMDLTNIGGEEESDIDFPSYNGTHGKNETNEQVITGTKETLNENFENTTQGQEILVNETISYEKPNGTNLEVYHSSQNASTSVVHPPSEEHAKEKSVSEDVNIDLIVYPIVIILVVIIIIIILWMKWHVRRTGSHCLDHVRSNIANEDPEACKMVMTELGKTPVGHEIVVM